MSIAIGNIGGFWSLRYNDGDELPNNSTKGFEQMTDKADAFNVDNRKLCFFNKETQTWTDPE